MPRSKTSPARRWQGAVNFFRARLRPWVERRHIYLLKSNRFVVVFISINGINWFNHRRKRCTVRCSLQYWFRIMFFDLRQGNLTTAILVFGVRLKANGEYSPRSNRISLIERGDTDASVIYVVRRDPSIRLCATRIAASSICSSIFTHINRPRTLMKYAEQCCHRKFNPRANKRVMWLLIIQSGDVFRCALRC